MSQEVGVNTESVSTAVRPYEPASEDRLDGDGGEPSARRVRHRTTPRALVLVAAILGAGMATILVAPLLATAGRAASLDDLGRRLDSSALAICLLALAALWTRHRIEPDQLNVDVAALISTVGVLALPLDLIAGEQAAAGAFVAVSRVVMIGLLGGMLIRPRDLTVGPRMRRAAWPPLAVVMLGAPLAMAWSRQGFDGASLRTTALGLSAGLLVLAALPLGVKALRRDDLRLELVAMTAVALGIADSVALGLDEASLATVAGKGTRTILLGSWLLITMFEIVDVALAERRQATEAMDEIDEATIKLFEQLRRHEQVVHDMRNALLAIQGGLGSIRHDPESRVLDSVEAEVERLRTSLDVLREDDLPRAFDVGKSLSSMVECYAAAGTRIHYIVDGDCVVNARESVVGEIVQNLIDNAVKFGGGGQITVWVFSALDQVQIRVGDRGDGVPESRHGAIFERHSSTGGGSGVGLHIARRLAESQGGALSVADRSGGGTVFTLSVPRATAGDRS